MSLAHSQDIRTKRLRLVATTVDHLRIELDHPEKLGAALNVTVPEGWPPGLYDRDAMQFFLAKSIEGGEAALGWYGWYAIDEQAANESKLIGSSGYFGPPTPEGDVEIGYSVVERERCRGYATEMVNALVERALESSCVERIFAEAHETNTLSLKVLERAGFVQIGNGREEGYLRLLYRGSKAKS